MDQALADALKQIFGSATVRVLSQLGVGIGLLYFIDKFFKVVEEKLNDDTKLEIAVWLLGLKTVERVKRWPDTFAKVFDRVFGDRHLSWKCFFRSCIASAITLVAVAAVLLLRAQDMSNFSMSSFIRALLSDLRIQVPVNIGLDYLSLLCTRYFISLTRRFTSFRATFLLLSLAILVSVSIAFGAWILVVSLDKMLYRPSGRYAFLHFLTEIRLGIGSLCASLFTSIWLWLYAGSGFLLKAAHRFDIGFQWFNRHFDIEKKPLQSIGLVSGALVAVLWWTVMLTRWLYGRNV
jgi:hypothetical protein